jgi:hypothetical protein
MTEPQQQLVPPHDLDAEESLLGAMLLSAPARTAAAERVTAADFYRRSHGTIFDAIMALHGGDEEVDSITVAHALERRHLLDEAGGRAAVHTLASTVPAVTNAAAYAAIVAEKAGDRRLLQSAEEIAHAVQNGGVTQEQRQRMADALLARPGSRIVGDAVEVVPLRAYLDLALPNAEPLLGTTEETVIAAGGAVLSYGTGGAGKTTHSIDGGVHMAAGVAWTGIAVPRPVTVTIIENEGPEAKFRQKLDRRIAAWTGPDVRDRIHVLHKPWSRFTFSSPDHRQQLAAILNETRTDLLLSGPVSTLGMVGGGTPDEITRFVDLLDELRALVDHPLAWWGIHHENRAGQISGAWERVPDTLIHVTGRGNGHTRIFWQKARHSSEHHQTALNLAWADGWTYTVEAPTEPVTAERVWEEIAMTVAGSGGITWRQVDEKVSGYSELKRETRDRMLTDGVLVNTATTKGRFILWHRDDPARPAPPEEMRL